MNTTSARNEFQAIGNDYDWKLNFISEKSKQAYSAMITKINDLIAICQQQSGASRVSSLNELKHSLNAVRDKIIGNNCCKYFFIQNNLLQALIPLLWLKDETNAEASSLIIECQKDALTLFSVLISQNITINWSDLPFNEIFGNLLLLLQGINRFEANYYFKFLEILTKSLVSFAKRVESVRDIPFTEENLPILIKLLNPQNSTPQISQNVAILLSTCCDGTGKQKILINLKVVEHLFEIINMICYVDDLGRLTIMDARILDGVIDILCTLTRDNTEICAFISNLSLRGRSISSILYQFLSLSSLSIELKLKISLLVIHLYKIDSTRNLSFEAQNVLLGFLLSLIDTNESYSARASYLLAFLVSDDSALQSSAIQMNVLNILLKMLDKAKAMDSIFYDKRLDCALIVIASLSTSNEENRKSIVECKFLSLIVESLSSSNTNLRISACQCARNLSRSVKNLRTNLFDAGIAKPLLKLLRDSSLIVQITACATICNMVLDFSPIKKVIVNEGAISDLVDLVSHSDVSLKINAIWSLKNLLYHSDNEIRSKVLTLLGFDNMIKLLEETNEAVQEQTLNLIRNIGCGKQENIEEVFNGFGSGKFISLLESKMQMTNPQIILQSLYIVVNVATGNELHKSRIMESSIIIQSIMNCLVHENSKIRLASIWSLINLTWPNEPGFIERTSFLTQLGALKILKSLQNDPDYDVRQKVSCAIANFSAAQ